MHSSKFFRYLWRINALIIFGAGIVLIGVLVFAALKIGQEVFRTREVRNVVNVEQGAGMKESLSLAHGQRIRGQTCLMVAMQSDQDYQQAYFKKSTKATRNYMFIAGDASSATWLFPHNSFLVNEATQLPSEIYGREGEPTKAILFVVTKGDTDGNHRITPDDLSVVALTRPDGRDYKEIAKDVVRVISHEIANDKLLLIYQARDGAFAASVSLEDFSVSRRELLPTPGKNS
jgi:hypothetical protein